MSKTRIFDAVRKLKIESIKELLDDNPSLLNVKDRMGRNLLHLACSLLKWLVRHGASPDIKDSEGVSARILASRKRDKRFLEALS